MIGAIIGDIVGSDYEFNNTSDYDFPLFKEGSDFTDDTICTVAVADAILNGEDYQTAMRRWCQRYPHPKGEYGGYFLNWVFRPDPAPYNSFGNGSAMRVSPVAWLFHSEKEVREHAEASAAITHNHPEGIKGAVAIAVAIFRMRKSKEKEGGIFKETAREFYGKGAFDNLPEKGYFDVTCQGCVPLALRISSEASDFEDAIRLAVAYGGDSDTIGAIVGSLAEARFPIPAPLRRQALSYLPPEMLSILKVFAERLKYEIEEEGVFQQAEEEKPEEMP